MRTSRFVLAAAAALATASLVGPAGATAGVAAPLTVVRQAAPSGQRPGPAILHAAPPEHVPQWENVGVWRAAPLAVSGASAYRKGEFLYQDYVYDDAGSYPTGPQYTQNDADLLEVRLKPLSHALAVRLTYQSMRTPDVMATTLSLGTSSTTHALPHAAGASTRAQVFVTVHGATADAVDAATGRALPGQGLVVEVDRTRRQVEVRVPYRLFDPRGRASVRLGAASGLWDPSAGGYAPVGPGTPSALRNVAFRYGESGTWFADEQAAALSRGDLSGLYADVDFRRLAARRDDELVGTRQGARRTGVIARLYASHFENAQGRGQANVPTGGLTGGGQPTPENCPASRFPKGCVLAYPNQIQPYALYVPPRRPPATGYGLTVYLHGAGGNYTTLAAANSVRQLGDRGTGSLVLLPNERGESNTYYGAAEADTFEAWADVRRHYALDPTLVAVTGESMGGVGTYKYAVEYPDLFSRAVMVIGYPYGWVDYAGPPAAQQTTAKGEYTIFYSALDSLRNLPVMSWNGAPDELVPYKAVRPAIDRLDRLGYRYEHLVFQREHFTMGLSYEQDAALAAAFLGSARVVTDPAHVTYVRDSNFQDARFGLDPDHAYWLSRVEPRSPAATQDEYGSAATFSRVDVVSSGFGTGDPVPTPTATDGGLHTIGGPFVRQARSWSAAPRTRVADRLDITARNTRSVTIDVRRARVSCQPRLVVDSDGPLTVVLAGCPTR